VALNQTLCTVFKTNLLKGVENFNTGSTYTYKIALYDSTATLNADTTEYTTAYVSFADVTWDPAAFTTRGALIYNSTTNAAVAVLNFGEDKTASSTFTVTFPTADASNAIIRIS
jgi:hypothetical protein